MLSKLYSYGKTFLAISGFRPDHATKSRAIFIGLSLIFTLYLSYGGNHNFTFAVSYFICSTLAYIGFISLCLGQEGLRLTFIKRYGEQKGYLLYESILAFCFFHNGASIGYISLVTAGELGWTQMEMMHYIFLIPILLGFAIKISAAHVVGSDIYYWKDMFLGRKICDFVESGPYKYFSNPMYGIGQIQAYGIALFYDSYIGLLVALINQLLVFTFYFAIEKKFIKRIYFGSVDIGIQELKGSII